MSEEDELSGFLEKLWAFAEKLILTPQGLALFALSIGVLLKVSHTPAHTEMVWVNEEQGRIPKLFPETRGMDILLWQIPVPATVGDAATYFDWFKALAPLGGPFSSLFSVLLPDFHAFEASREPLIIKIYLSDVLIVAGAAGLGLSSVGGLAKMLL